MSVFGSREETPQEAARRNVRSQVEQLVRNLAVAGYGATIVETPVEGYQILTDKHLDPAIDGMSAAWQVQRVAGGVLEQQALAARGAGYSWEQIARALGITEDKVDDPGLTAYLFIVQDVPLPDSTPAYQRREQVAHWTCYSCKQRVKDVGPYGGHPTDLETGHADSCEAFNAVVAEYLEQWDSE